MLVWLKTKQNKNTQGNIKRQIIGRVIFVMTNKGLQPFDYKDTLCIMKEKTPMWKNGQKIEVGNIQEEIPMIQEM